MNDVSDLFLLMLPSDCNNLFLSPPLMFGKNCFGLKELVRKLCKCLGIVAKLRNIFKALTSMVGVRFPVISTTGKG